MLFLGQDTGLEEFRDDSSIVAAKDQVSCDLGGETVILNLRDSIYYGLTEVGFRVWNLIQEPQTVGDICRILLKQYEVDPVRCKNDLLALLQEMKTRGLIEIR